MLPEHLRQEAGLGKKIKIDKHEYIAYPMTSLESIKYYDLTPSSMGEQVTGQALKANAYAIYITLKKNHPKEMKDDTFKDFLSEIGDLMQFVSKFNDLLIAVVAPDSKMLKKKD